MGKVYVQPIQGAWQDDVGKKMHAEANREIEVVNNVAQSMESALKEVDRHRNDNLEYIGTLSIKKIIEVSQNLMLNYSGDIRPEDV